MKDIRVPQNKNTEDEDFLLNDNSISEREEIVIAKDINPHFIVKKKSPEISNSSINESNSFRGSPTKLQYSNDNNVKNLSTKNDGLMIDNDNENEKEKDFEKERKQENIEEYYNIKERNKSENIKEFKQDPPTVKKNLQSNEYNSNDLENIKNFKYAYKLLEQKLNGPIRISESQERSLPVENRLIKYKESLQEKAELKKQQIELLELKECTFKPRVNSSVDRRTFEQFLENQHSFITKKNEKISQKEQEIRSSVDLNYKFKPEINPNSVKINLVRQSNNNLLPQDPIYIKLFNLQYQKKPNITEENEPIPKINKKSENLNRDCKIEERLYNDAIRRQDSQSSKVLNSSNTLQFSKSLKTENNYEFTNSKFKKEYNKILASLGLDQNVLNFDQVKCILTVMGFIKYDANVPEILNSLWNILSGGMNIASKESLLNLLLIIMKIIPDKFLEVNNKIIEFGNLTYVEIQEQFKSLFVSKITFNNSRIVSQKARPPVKLLQLSPQFKFHPDIEPHSKTLAKKYKDKLINTKIKLNDLAQSPPSSQSESVEDLLIFSKKVNQEKINRIKKEIEIKDSSNCTFKPSLIPYNSSISISLSSTQPKNSLFKIYNRKTHNNCLDLYETSIKDFKNKFDKKDKTSDEIQYERNLTEYTFKPNISKNDVLKLIPSKTTKKIELQITKDNERSDKFLLQEKKIENRRNYNSIKLQTQPDVYKSSKSPINNDNQNKTSNANKQNVIKKPEKIISQGNKGDSSDISIKIKNSSRVITNVSSSSNIKAKQNKLSLYSSKLDLLKNEIKLNLKTKHSYYNLSKDLIPSSKGFNQDHLNYQKSNHRLPLLFIDVSMNDNSTKRIVLYEGDSPHLIVQQFLQENQLDERLIGQLCEIIEEKIKNNQ